MLFGAKKSETEVEVRCFFNSAGNFLSNEPENIILFSKLAEKNKVKDDNPPKKEKNS